MTNKIPLKEVDIQMLDSLDDYSEKEILDYLKYLNEKLEKLQDEIDYEYESILGWDI